MLCTTADKGEATVRKKHWTKAIPWILFVSVVAALIIIPMKVGNKSEQESFEYVSATAELRDITSSLSGGGTINSPEKQDVTVPDGVEVTRFLVSNGEYVEEGQPVAEVDGLTVLAAVERVRTSMTAMEKRITELVNAGGDASLRCIADGRVKAVYAKTGDDVRSVMIKYGSLGIVSLDGLMSADVACDSRLLTGDPVNVKCTNGKEYPGRVSLSLNGTLTVTVTDDGPEFGEIVEVYDMDGSLLGAGALKVNSPWKVVSADGIVGSVNMKPGQKVDNGTILVRLRETGATEKENCSRKHREYEDLLQDLLKMLQSGNITAPCDGFVSGVDKAKATGLGAGTEHKLTLLSYYAGDKDASIAIYTLILVTSVNEDGSIVMGKVISVPSSIFPDNINPATVEGKEYLLSDDGKNSLLRYTSAMMSSISETKLNIKGSADGVPIAPGNVYLIGGFDIPAQCIGQISFPDPGNNGSGGGGFGASDEEGPDMFPTDKNVLLSVTPIGEMSVTITVDELDILRYSEGMPADIFIDAIPGESFTGIVTKIAAVGTNSGGSSKFDVTVALPYSDRFLAGMNASVVIHTGSTGGVVTVPAIALKDSGSRCIVYTGYDEKNNVLINPVTVETGASDGEYVEIVSGLEAGQTVWYANYLTVTK